MVPLEHMQDRLNLQAPVSTESAPSADVRRAPWQAEAAALLRQVAKMCVEHQVDVETFMRSAWATYVDARPGMREELETKELEAQLAALREAGKIGLA
jgi:hypothetical protein